MKKVCFFSLNAHYFFHESGSFSSGGAELDMYLVGKHLALDKDFETSFIVGDVSQKVAIEEIDNIRVYKSITLEKKNLFRGIFSVFKIWSLLGKINADYYIQSGATHYGGIIALYCKYKKRKFIYRTAHHIDCDGTFVNQNGFLGKAYEFGLLNSDKIIVSVKDHKDLLEQKYGKINLKEKVIYIPLALEVSKKRDITLEKRHILWVARGTYWKNPDIFIDLCEQFSNERFVMIMPKQRYEEQLFERVKNRVEKISNIDFQESVPFDKIQDYFDKAKVFVNTSEFEGFTFTLLQSGLGHSPVLYFKVNPDSVISQNNLGYCADGDIQKMYEYMEKLLSDKEDWLKKSENCYNYIKESHNIENIMDIYKTVIFKNESLIQ